MKQVITVPGLPDSTANGYAQCVVAGGAVYVAGQTAVDDNYDLVSLEFEPQARRALENVGRALSAAGASFDDLVSMTVFLADARHSRDFLTVRNDVLGGSLMASAVVSDVTFVKPGVLIEIQAVAVLP